MEAILGIIGICIAWYLFGLLISAGSRTISAAGKAVVGKGSFSENMDLAFKGMGQFEVKFVDTHLNDDGTGGLVKEIHGKGLFPIGETRNIGFITSVFDETDAGFEPVLSAIDTFQEGDSIVYQHNTNLGQIESGMGFPSWVRLGVVIPDIIEPPYSGERNLQVIIRMVDLDNAPDITHGFHTENDPGILWQRSLKFTYTFHDKGYQEASEHRDEAVGISLKIGMAVAMADGSLDDAEGNVLKNWVVKAISPFSEEKKGRLKKLYNDALRESYNEAKEGDLSLSILTERLNEIGEKTSKYEAVELCFEVMAADGVADSEEINTIRKVAEALNLDADEVAKMRDQKIVGLDASVSDHASIEVMLGIEPDWTNDEIKKHLRSEFQKWNNRLNTLPEGSERSNAQLMLDKIAEARKRYV